MYIYTYIYIYICTYVLFMYMYKVYHITHHHDPPSPAPLPAICHVCQHPVVIAEDGRGLESCHRHSATGFPWQWSGR